MIIETMSNSLYESDSKKQNYSIPILSHNEHAAEIDRYQKARDILRSYTAEGKFPSLKSLQARKTELLEIQKAPSVELENMRKSERTISVAAQNVRYILEGTVERVPAAHRDVLHLQIT